MPFFVRLLSTIVLLGCSGAFAGAVELTDDEQVYLRSLGPITLVVDPDWVPYESLDANGRHVGIAADLVRLIAQRSGVELQLVPTKNWDESIALSKEGRALVVGFLNQTPKRDEWLVFTDPYLTDPNVFITREEHEYISDPARLSGESVALPSGTSMEEWLRAEYPNLQIVLTANEQDAVRMVSEKQADMTLRSLTMAAYTIKSQGLFNLKIAGQIPTFTNQFRLGVSKAQPRLRDLLNRGVAGITPQDVQEAVNRHVSIRVQQGWDWRPLLALAAVFFILAAAGGLWIGQLRRLNAQLAAREAEKAVILKEVHHRIKNNMAAVQGMLYLQADRVPGTPTAAALEDAQARLQSMMVLYDQLYRSDDYGTVQAKPYLTDLVHRIVANFPRHEVVTVTTEIADLAMPTTQLQPLGILLNELLTNAMKYAFKGRDAGHLHVGLGHENGRVTLVVADDGIGMKGAAAFDHAEGFGMQLVAMMAQQLGAALRFEQDGGTRIVVVMDYAHGDAV